MNQGPPSLQRSTSVRPVVVTTAEQQAHAFAVRAICFLEERMLPFGDDFDGNDFDATHIVMYCCCPRTTGHGHGTERALMNSRGER